MSDTLTNTTDTVDIPQPIDAKSYDILIIGESKKSPSEADNAWTKHKLSSIPQLYGAAPYSISELADPANDDATKAKISRSLDRSIAHQCSELAKMLTSAQLDEHHVFVYNISESTSASLILKENDSATTGNEFDLPVSGKGKAEVCFNIVARRSGDEANGFSVALTVDNVTGKASTLSLAYQGVVSPTTEVITDPDIARPYLIDLEGLTILQLQAELTKPANPFSRYLKVEPVTPLFSKLYPKFDVNSRINMVSTDEDGLFVGGAYRLEDIEAISISNSDPIVITPGTAVLNTNSEIVQDPINGSIVEPLLTYEIHENVTKHAGLLDKRNIAIVSNPDMIKHATNVYSSVYSDVTKLAAFDGNFANVNVMEMLGDGVLLTSPEQFSYNPLTGRVEIAKYIIDGLMNDDGDVFDVADKHTPGEFLESSDYVVAVTYVDVLGKESLPSTYKRITTDPGAATSLALTFKHDEDVAVKSFKIYISQTIGGLESEPLFAEEVTPPLGVKAGLEHIISVVPVLKAQRTPSIDGTIYAIEFLNVTYKLKPRFREAQSLDKMPKNLWNNYFINKNSITLGTALPNIGDGNTMLTANVNIIYDLRNSEINIISKGDSGRQEDTISLDFNPGTTMVNLNGGDLKVVYRVYPQMPAHNRGTQAFLLGGSDNANMSEENYAAKAIDGLNFAGQIIKPSNVIVLGLHTKMYKDVRDPITRLIVQEPIDVVTDVNNVINAINAISSACVLHMSDSAPVYRDMTDDQIQNWMNTIVFDATRPGFGTEIGYTAYDSKGSASNKQIFFCCGDFNRLTDIPGFGTFWLPLDTALINLRDQIVQNYLYDTTAFNFSRLPRTSYKSRTKPLTDSSLEAINNAGFSYYGTFRDTSRNLVVAGCAGTARTGFMLTSTQASLAAYSNYVMAQTLIIKTVKEYLDAEVRGNSSLDDLQLKSIAGSAIEYVKNKFVKLPILNELVIELAWVGTTGKLLGRLNVTGNTTFNATARNFDMNFGFTMAP